MAPQSGTSHFNLESWNLNTTYKHFPGWLQEFKWLEIWYIQVT